MTTSAADETVLVPTGATWKYLDDGTNQGTAWRATAFDDTTWASGAAELGYGDGDEATVVSYGPSSSSKYMTTYFRHSFSVADPNVYTAMKLRLLVDDGAVVYLNGSEVYRANMSSSTISYTTAAGSTLDGVDEDAFRTHHFQTPWLIAGTNVLAVEVHQRSATSSDISFNVELVGTNELMLARGPYLQSGSHDRMTLRWRTNSPSESRVLYGDSPGNLAQVFLDNTLTTEHEVALTGLAAGTTYYYAVGSASELLAGADADHHFTTTPAPGATQAKRIWVLGDSGTANSSAAAVQTAFDNFNGSSTVDLMLMLGDNAYVDGSDSDYQVAVFDMYPSHLRRTPLWPTLGNHDGHTADSPTESGPYYEMFTLPRAAEAGGVASGTEAYYSFDYGNIHFICLDSFDTDRSTAGPMMTWLENDLANANQHWIIAFWHHPPYSKGSHDSDAESRLVDMREVALPILESYGVDLILSGHSHSYERSFLLDGHYGLSSTLTPEMKINAGSGRIDGDGAYAKEAETEGPRRGAVYVVAGSSGKIESGSLNHPAMYISMAQLGSMVLDVEAETLDAKFIRSNGVIADYFTITKTAGSSIIKWSDIKE